MSTEYKKFLKDEAKRKPALRCSIHDSTYSEGSQCYFCRTGFKPSDIGKDLMPKPSAVRRLARKSDPSTAHDGVARIREILSDNRRKILALEFPPTGLNYRQIAAQSGIYPTTASRTITTMYREGSLVRVGKDKGGFLYAPQNGLISPSRIIDDAGDEL